MPAHQGIRCRRVSASRRWSPEIIYNPLLLIGLCPLHEEQSHHNGKSLRPVCWYLCCQIGNDVRPLRHGLIECAGVDVGFGWWLEASRVHRKDIRVSMCFDHSIWLLRAALSEAGNKEII